jgi:hypothetical protein
VNNSNNQSLGRGPHVIANENQEFNQDMQLQMGPDQALSGSDNSDDDEESHSDDIDMDDDDSQDSRDS